MYISGFFLSSFRPELNISKLLLKDKEEVSKENISPQIKPPSMLQEMVNGHSVMHH